MPPVRDDIYVSDRDGERAAVCVAHARFIPCRKGSPESKCVISYAAADIEKVRYYHKMSVQDRQRERQDRQLQYVPFTCDPEDWPLEIFQSYDGHALGCSSLVIRESSTGIKFPVTCHAEFSPANILSLREDVTLHIENVPHYQWG